MDRHFFEQTVSLALRRKFRQPPTSSGAETKKRVRGILREGGGVERDGGVVRYRGNMTGPGPTPDTIADGATVERTA